MQKIEIKEATAHNLKQIDVAIERNTITVVSGVSGAGKSTLVLDVILREAQRRFLQTMSLHTRKFFQVFTQPEVKTITGLSPALVLPQSAPPLDASTTVGKATGISELWRILFVSIGDKKCPHHGISTAGQTTTAIKNDFLARYLGETLILAAPAKSNNMEWQKKYLRAIFAGSMHDLTELPQHRGGDDLSVVIDIVKIKPSAEGRLERSINQSLLVGDGHGQLFRQHSGKLELVGYFSTQASCPVCSFSWPQLDVRHFAENSLGACPACQGRGCNICANTGLKPELQAITIAGKSLTAINQMPFDELKNLVLNLIHARNFSGHVRTVLHRIRDELLNLQEIGLDYLTPERKLVTLSRGEQQKIRIATLISESLNGVIYILDEPSQGLATSEVERLWQKFLFLKERGNTVIVIDHHRTILEKADCIIDLGPGGGIHGGKVVATFDISTCSRFKAQSATARFLGSSVTPAPATDEPRQFISLIAPETNNLRIDKVRFAKQAINVVTGVSGAGKSSLIEKCLYASLRGKNIFDNCQAITGIAGIKNVFFGDRKPLASRQKGIVATHLDIFSWLRRLFGQLKDSQIAGFQPRDFSLSVAGGRCEHCRGTGLFSASPLSYLPAVPCSVCAGHRYSAEIQQITYRGHSISAVLELTVSEAMEFFRNFTKITDLLRPAIELGLGYLRLGQKTSELSGGEGQRLKLVPVIAKTRKDTVLILDEPTGGLHFQDTALLHAVFRRLVWGGATIILIEHNQEIIAQCDWLIELGPGGGRNGGLLTYQGPPAEHIKTNTT